MARKTFHQEMQEVKDEVLLLGSMVEQAVTESVGALRDHDLERSRQVLSNARAINRKRYEIETFIIMLIATRQPIARDLRALAASLGICTELERMGDYAKGIATINLRSQGLSLPLLLREIHSMAEKTMDMLDHALTAFAEEDAQVANPLIRYDDVIDECYTKLYADAINSVIRDPRKIEHANYVIWVAHNLERLGDRVTNVCEGIVYMITGVWPAKAIKVPELTLVKYES